MAVATKTISVPAQVAKQEKWTIYTFVMSSRQLDKIATISRRAENKDEGYQRNLNRRRAAEISAYIEQQNGVLPNNIIIAFTGPVKFSPNQGILNIPDEEDVAWIIDGQHRMYGLRLAKKPYDVVVTAFLELSIEDQAKVFKKINSEQRGVPSSLLYDLLDLTKDGTFVQQRGHELATRLNEDSASPWFGMIDLLGTGGGFITQTRVVTGL